MSVKPLADLGLPKTPWVQDNNRPGYEGFVTVFDADGNELVNFGHMEDCDLGDIAEANLYAAAPDLYEALRQMVCLDITDHLSWRRSARAALQKAQGKTFDQVDGV